MCFNWRIRSLQLPLLNIPHCDILMFHPCPRWDELPVCTPLCNVDSLRHQPGMRILQALTVKRQFDTLQSTRNFRDNFWGMILVYTWWIITWTLSQGCDSISPIKLKVSSRWPPSNCQAEAQLGAQWHVWNLYRRAGLNNMHWNPCESYIAVIQIYNDRILIASVLVDRFNENRTRRAHCTTIYELYCRPHVATPVVDQY